MTRASAAVVVGPEDLQGTGLVRAMNLHAGMWREGQYALGTFHTNLAVRDLDLDTTWNGDRLFADARHGESPFNSPLSPVLGGEGSGVRGLPIRRLLPPPPPPPPRVEGRGAFLFSPTPTPPVPTP